MRVLIIFALAFLLVANIQAQSNKLILVLDIQEYYTNKNKGGEVDAFINNVNNVIDQAAPGDVVYIKTYSLAIALSFKGTKIDTLPGHEFDERLHIINDQIYDKSTGNAFDQEKLVAFIEQNNYKEIIIIGLLAEKCVYKTLMAGLEKGYTMYTIPDAIIGKSEKSKQKLIRKIEQKGVNIIKEQTTSHSLQTSDSKADNKI